MRERRWAGKSLSIGVKICGITAAADLEAAVEAGASHCGLVFFPPSPRSLSLEAAAKLAARGRGRVTLVALMVNPDDALVRDVTATVAPEMVQLHGKEDPARTARIREMAGVPVIKAVSVAEAADVARADAWRHAADLILFDAKAPKHSAIPGGNGLAFDWRLLAGVASRMDFALSGGLTPENVAEAIAATRPVLVDVSSGVETAPGKKDPALIRRFVAAARATVLEGAAHG
jgi:phosphoribosylanthranilate isomerase